MTKRGVSWLSMLTDRETLFTRHANITGWSNVGSRRQQNAWAPIVSTSRDMSACCSTMSSNIKLVPSDQYSLEGLGRLVGANTLWNHNQVLRMAFHEASVTKNRQGKGARPTKQLLEVKKHISEKDDINNCVRNSAKLLEEATAAFGLDVTKIATPVDHFERQKAVQPIPWDSYKEVLGRKWSAKDESGRARHCEQELDIKICMFEFLLQIPGKLMFTASYLYSNLRRVEGCQDRGAVC